jgi:hypothetical protein
VLTEVWLGKKDLIRARQEVERFLNCATATAERTWQALAWEVNARVAIAEIDLKRAQDCVSRALVTMEGFEIPLADWRVHATAAEVSQRSEDMESIQRQREISRVAILKLANSLAPEDPLRKTFLSALSVSKILAEPTGGNYEIRCSVTRSWSQTRAKRPKEFGYRFGYRRQFALISASYAKLQVGMGLAGSPITLKYAYLS